MQALFKPHHGALRLFINDQPQPLVSFKPTEIPDEDLFDQSVQTTVPDMAKRGVHVQFVPIFWDWTGPDDLDFAPAWRRIRKVLAADPGAWIVIRVQAAALNPDWWLEQNPGQVLAFGVNEANDAPAPPFQTKAFPSIASSFWRDTAIPALTRFARQVRQQDFADRVIGYLPTAYNTNEWFVRSYGPLHVNDLSPAMQQAFGRHLKETAGLDAGPEPVPNRLDRGLTPHGMLHSIDPASDSGRVVAYYRFVNEHFAQTIVDITDALRKAHEPDRVIVGTFYGYSHGLANHYWLPDSGHLALRRLLEDDGPDFTCSPLEYMTRNPREPMFGGFCWAQSTAPDSGRLAGKAYIGEDDFAPPDMPPVGWSSATDLAEDAELLKRNFMFALAKGQSQWWYDLHGHWYEPPERLETIERCSRIARDAIDHPHESVSRVLVVADETSSWHYAPDREMQRALSWESLYKPFAHLGMPIEVIMATDLPKIDPEPYRLIALPSTIAADDRLRAQIDRLKGGGRTLVFGMLCGFIRPGASPETGAEHMTSLTGIHLVENTRPLDLRLTALPEHPLCGGESRHVFGACFERIPTVRVEDEDAETIARFAAGGPVGLARKQMDGWTSVVCCVPSLSHTVARRLAVEAGAWLYLQTDDVLYVNAGYACVFTRSGGERRLRLPEPRRFRELFRDAPQSDTPVDNIVWDAQPLTSYLFKLET